LKDAIARRSEMPTKVRFQEMVDRGVIDSEGRVLLRMPPPPKRRNKKTP